MSQRGDRRKDQKRREERRRVAIMLLVSLLLHLLALFPLLLEMLRPELRPEDDKPPRRLVVYEVSRPRKPPAAKLPAEEAARPEDRRAPQEQKARRKPRPRPRPRPRPPRPRKRPPRPRPRKKARPRPKPKKKPKLQRQKFELRRKMVEQDSPEDEPAPKDYRFFADKNRNVEEETRAKETILNDKPKDRPRVARAPKKRIGHDKPSKDPKSSPRPARPRTAPKRKKAKRPDPKKKKQKPLRKPRESRVARKPRPGPEKKRKDEKKPRRNNALSMRNPPRQTRPAEEKKKALRLQADDRGEHRVVDDRNAKAQRSRRSRKLVIRPKDSQLQRLFAKKWAEEAERNKDPHRRKSHGRASASPSGRRWKKIRAAIENYIAEVKPGRVTALRTRHHPFAKYIAAAHRKIHPLWGDGILEDWDSKPKEHPLSVRSRWAMVEMVINRDGTLYKAGLVKSSGYLVYDAAALDVVFSAAPYPRAPKKILSADGKVYLHWRFHRDHRQCGTFGVDAYILTNPPKGKQVDRAHTKKRSDSVRWDPGRSLDRVRRKTGAMKGRAVEVGGSGSSGGSGGSGGSGVSGGSGGSGGSAGRSYAPSPNRKSPPGGKPSGEGSTGGKPSGEGSTGGESSRRSGPVNPASAANDAETAEVASGWLRAVSAKDIDTLLELSAVPFSANGRVVARKPKELRAAFTGLLGDSTGSRGPATSKRVYVLSGAELRRYLGALPSRLKTDPSHTYAVGTISGQRVILVMEESQGKSKIIGIFR